MTGNQADAAAKGGPLRAFASRDFSLFWFASLLSIIAFFMLLIARGWLILEMTDSPFMVTAVAGVAQVPSLLLSIPGGVLADRYNRKTILLVGEAVNGLSLLTLAILIATDNVQIWHIFATGLVNGSSFALAFPSRAAVVPNLVPPKDIANGVALSSTMFSGAQLIGPALAGFLLAAFAMSVSFFVAAAASTLAVLVFIPVHIRAGMPREMQPKTSVLTSVAEGFSYIRHSQIVLGLMVIGFVIVIFGMSYQTVLPVFARDVLHAGTGGLGLLAAAGGAGAIIGSLAVATYTGPRAIRLFLGGGAIGLGAMIFFFAISPIFALSLVFSLFAGFALQLAFTANFAMLQVLVPDELRGRVLSVRFIIFGLAPAGTISLGIGAERFGTPSATAVVGLLCLIGAVVVLLVFPSLLPTKTATQEKQPVEQTLSAQTAEAAD